MLSSKATVLRILAALATVTSTDRLPTIIYLRRRACYNQPLNHTESQIINSEVS